MDWYAIRGYSGKEKKIKETIMMEAERNDLDDLVDQVMVPSENVVEMRDGKKRVRDKVFFPGYILVKMELTKETQYLIENTPGVLNFVGPKGAPQPLRPEEVKRILGEVEEKEGREVVETPYKVGDPIKVTDGPFVDFSGFVEEVNEEKQKVKVRVSIFGRPTPVELDYLQVELEK
ncbi:MAG: transcription termination/antitermination factor NusG [Candidatus Marinimicrobia bacterium]|jgi:transcriptional antiterminator NusG|nr:transcription termination/antitermination factor NusG [Candidatus Neomarinimicrobiota bacterium]